MRCPYCGQNASRVVDSRPMDNENAIRRKRLCEHCGKRFITWEKTEVIPLTVIKKDGARVPFDSQKILSGMMKACYKRPVSIEVMQEKVNQLEMDLNQRGENEISSGDIGEAVMDVLKELDQIAYVRFASVYREFKDAESFMEELRSLLEKS